MRRPPRPEKKKRGHLAKYKRSRRPGGVIRFTGAGHYAEVHPDGSVTFEPNKWHTVVGSFDLTDMVMRALGQFPYGREKLDFLDATWAWRRRLRRRFRARLEQGYFARLPAVLRGIRARSGWSPARKRRLLFELWDEMLEPDHPERRRARRAQEARAIIVAFAGRAFPAGSATGYTSAELAAFRSERRGLMPFRPYSLQTR